MKSMAETEDEKSYHRKILNFIFLLFVIVLFLLERNNNSKKGVKVEFET